MGIRHLSTLDPIANNDQQRCYLACSDWAIQIGYWASTPRFRLTEFYRIGAYNPDLQALLNLANLHV